MGCKCPIPTVMPTVDPTVCEFDIKEVWRLWPVRSGEVIWDLVGPLGAANVPAAIIGDVVEDSAGWTTLRAAVDSTKVLILPNFASDVTLAPGAEQSTIRLSNRKKHQGLDPSEFVAFYEGLTAAQEAGISDLKCEDVEVFMIMYDKGIIGQTDNVATPTTFKGISLASAMVLFGRGITGFNESDKNQLNFQLPADWSHTMHKITPNFNTLTF